VVDTAGKHPGHAVRLLDNPGRIVATGLNAALRSARGDIIVRTDGHCRIAKDYISRCVDHLNRDSADGVGGSINTIASTPGGRAIAAVMSSPFGVGGSSFRTVKERTMLVDTVPFPAYTRRAIEMAGPFDEELVRNQDDEYNYRSRQLWKCLHAVARIHRFRRPCLLSLAGGRGRYPEEKVARRGAAVSDMGLSDRADDVDLARRIINCRSCLARARHVGNRNSHRVDGRADLFFVA